MSASLPTKYQVGVVSGATADQSAFTVLRWDARSSPTHESSETVFFTGDGDRFLRLATSQGPFGGAWRAPSGAAHFSMPGRIVEVRAQGESVERVTHDVAGLFPEMWGRFDDEAFAWGTSSMLRWNGATWAPCAWPGEVYAMHGASRTQTYAVGRRGLVARWDGGAWRVMEPAHTGDLLAVHVVDEHEMYAIAKPGVILEGSALGWRVRVDTGRTLRGIAKFQGRLFVAVEGEGLYELDARNELVLVKDTFKPHQIECRGDLLIGAREHVVRSVDGARYVAYVLPKLRELIERKPPIW